VFFFLTLKRELDFHTLKMYRHTKNEASRYSKVKARTGYRDSQTNAIERITSLHVAAVRVLTLEYLLLFIAYTVEDRLSDQIRFAFCIFKTKKY